MKLSFNILSLLCLISAPSLSLCTTNTNGVSHSRSITADLKVPGSSPLQYCDDKRSADILELEHFDVDPNPPLPGNNGTVDAAGTLKKDIEQGAYIKLQVKFNKYITILKTTMDLCEQVKSAGKECPLNEGLIKVTQNFSMPEQIPKGIWTVIADIYTKDDERITCVTAEVDYSKQSVAEL